MKWYWLVLLILAAWFPLSVGLGMLVGPVLKRNSQAYPLFPGSDEEEVPR